MTQALKVAVILPCFNEELTIGDTINVVQKSLKHADIYVCDIASTDRTAEIAAVAGATVIFEPRKGKAQAVSRMINAIDADVFVMCDGDSTYDLSAAPGLVKKLQDDHLDMIIGRRKAVAGQNTWRIGHSFGNRLFTTALNLFFGGKLTDVLSGYRVFSGRFAKSMPILSRGFDIEIEMTVHALATGLSIGEVQTNYFERPQGSTSKLNTFRDGWRIAKTLLRLIIDFQPLRISLLAAFLQCLAAVLLFVPIWQSFNETGLVEKVPTAILCVGLVITSLLTCTCGVILDAISRQSISSKKLAYLNAGPSRR